MCDEAPPSPSALDTLRAREAEQQAELEALLQKRPLNLRDVSALEAELEVTKAAIVELDGPPPVRYSAVGRMRQRTEGMGMDKDAQANEGLKLQSENILPPVGGLVNIAIILAVVAAAAAAVSGSL
jgi:hypothetical protein